MGLYDAEILEESILKNVLNIPYADVRAGKLRIFNLDYRRLSQRIEELYEEKNFFKLFDVIYNSSDLSRYRRKRMHKKSMRITRIEVDLFFALEVQTLMLDLYEKYNYKYYKKIADQVDELTWVGHKKKYKDVSIKLDGLKDMSYTLKEYQLDFIRDYVNIRDKNGLEGFILSFDQGLGKTLTSVALSHLLKKEQTIIVCPNTLKGNWAYEIKAYFKKYADTKIFDREVYIVGQGKFDKKFNKFVIVNLEAISTVLPYINSTEDTMIIVDESHNFRNIEGKRTQELINLKYKTSCKDVLLMSGTPIKAIPNEIVPAMRLIDPLFTDEVAVVYKRMFDVEGLLTANIFKRRFSQIMHRKTKAEVLTLPNKYIEDKAFPLDNGEDYTLAHVRMLVTNEFKRLYELETPKITEYKREYLGYIRTYSRASEFRTNRYIEYCEAVSSGQMLEYHELDLEEFKMFTLNFVKPYITDREEYKRFLRVETLYMRLQQSCMGRALGAILPKYRTQLFIDLYETHKASIFEMIDNEDKKCVIFSPFRTVVEHLYKDLEENGYGVVKLVGGTKDRMEVIKNFKECDDVDIIIATTQTMATGVTLTEAALMLFFGTPWRSTDFDQCCDRIYRIGQTKDVHIYKIILSTSRLNLSNRIDDILQWSNSLFTGFVEIDGIEGE